MSVATRINNLRERFSLDPGSPDGDTLSAPASDDVLFDEELLTRLQRLVMLSRNAIAQGIAGEHRSRRKGTSPEFADFKSYSQGDDFRRIDWNIYSRLDELFVRMSEVTTEMNVHFLLDASESMNWRGSRDVRTKFAYARLVTGSLAYVSLWKYDRVQITPFSDALGNAFGPSQGRSHASRLIGYLSDLSSAGSTNISHAIRHYADIKRQPGMMFIVSDLLSGEPNELRGALHHLRTRGWEVTVLHIIDRAELEPGPSVPRQGDLRPMTLELTGAESNDRLTLTPTEDILERYEAAVNEWLFEIQEACQAEAAFYIPLHTDWSFESLVLTRLYDAGVVA